MDTTALANHIRSRIVHRYGEQFVRAFSQSVVVLKNQSGPYEPIFSIEIGSQRMGIYTHGYVANDESRYSFLVDLADPDCINKIVEKTLETYDSN